MNTKINALETHNRNHWESLFDQYAEFYKLTPPSGCKDKVWNWIFDKDEPFWCSVAKNSHGQIIGFVQYQLMHRSLSGAKVCYLSDLYVIPEQRKSGTGRALIDHVIDFAQRNGIDNVRWLTQDSNVTAKGLYETYVAQSEFVLYSFPVKSK